MNNFKLLYGLDIPHKSLVYKNGSNRQYLLCTTVREMSTSRA
jgi:hypothetical protein